MSQKVNLKQAWASLIEEKSFVIGCHLRPDGDVLGSSLALARVLRGLGKEVVVVSEDGVPENYSFFPGSDTVVTGTPRRDFDFGVLVDSESPKRVGSAAEPLTSARRKACIDHHVPNGQFGEVRVVDTTASATGVLIYELLEANGVEIDTETATLLMAGIIADTGGFRFGNTDSRSLEIAARLSQMGAEPSSIYRAIFDSKPVRAAKLLGRALNSLHLDPTGRVIWAQITQDDLHELGATDADTDSVVNHVGAVKGPQVAILFRETKPDAIRTSLRSRGGYDVDRVARKFGGGGHKAAAGCTVEAPLDTARKMVVDEVLKWME